MTATNNPEDNKPVESVDVAEVAEETKSDSKEVVENGPEESINPKRKKMSKRKKLIITLSVILAIIIALVSAFFITVKIGESRLRNSLISGENVDGDYDFDANAIFHNGKTYYYNKDLINILLIGVDENDFSKESHGQADAIYLISVDTKKDKVNIVSISRNTMTDVNVLDAYGDVYGTENQQICLAYAHGIDDESSSKNTADAVSRLLYNVPINGYYTLHMKSISDIVNSVGGVSVTIPKDCDPHFSDRIGKTVNLFGDEALLYLRMRGESNAPRVERHKTFIKSFVNSAKRTVKKDVSLPIKLWNKLSSEAVTNIKADSIVYLAVEALDWQLNILNIAGEYGSDGTYETFDVNEDALRETVINAFYTEKKQ